jgi:hypothetical protein
MAISGGGLEKIMMDHSEQELKITVVQLID